MPYRNRFFVALPFKQFLSTLHLRIPSIANLEPCAVFSLHDVRPGFVLRNNALQIQVADTLKQCHPRAVNILGILQRTVGRSPCQQPPKFLFSVYLWKRRFSRASKIASYSSRVSHARLDAANWEKYRYIMRDSIGRNDGIAVKNLCIRDKVKVFTTVPQNQALEVAPGE